MMYSTFFPRDVRLTRQSAKCEPILACLTLRADLSSLYTPTRLANITDHKHTKALLVDERSCVLVCAPDEGCIRLKMFFVYSSFCISSSGLRCLWYAFWPSFPLISYHIPIIYPYLFYTGQLCLASLRSDDNIHPVSVLLYLIIESHSLWSLSRRISRLAFGIPVAVTVTHVNQSQ